MHVKIGLLTEITHTHTQQVLTGWRPHSQNTDMQIGKLQTERRRWNEERKEREQMGESEVRDTK